MRRRLFILVELLVARSNNGALDTNGCDRIVALDRRVINRVCDLDSFRHSTEGRKLPIKVRTISYQDEEMSGSTIWFVAPGHRNDATNVFEFAWLIGKFPRSLL